MPFVLVLFEKIIFSDTADANLNLSYINLAFLRTNNYNPLLVALIVSKEILLSILSEERLTVPYLNYVYNNLCKQFVYWTINLFFVAFYNFSVNLGTILIFS